MMETLTDGVVRLRPRREGDVETALAWYRDPHVLKMSEGTGATPFDRPRVERMYAILEDIGELYMIEVLDGGRWVTVGDVTLARSTLPVVIGEAAFRGRGVGGRVLDLLIARARALGWSRLEVKGIHTYNRASQALCESRGFKPAGSRTDESGRTLLRYSLDLARA